MVHLTAVTTNIGVVKKVNFLVAASQHVHRGNSVADESPLHSLLTEIALF